MRLVAADVKRRTSRAKSPPPHVGGHGSGFKARNPASRNPVHRTGDWPGTAFGIISTRVSTLVLKCACVKRPDPVSGLSLFQPGIRHSRPTTSKPEPFNSTTNGHECTPMKTGPKPLSAHSDRTHQKVTARQKEEVVSTSFRFVFIRITIPKSLAMTRKLSGGAGARLSPAAARPLVRCRGVIPGSRLGRTCCGWGQPRSASVAALPRQVFRGFRPHRSG